MTALSPERSAPERSAPDEPAPDEPAPREPAPAADLAPAAATGSASLGVGVGVGVGGCDAARRPVGLGQPRLALLRRGSRLLENPLLRNGHALNLSTAASSLAGLAFWLVAARRYSITTVGRNAAAISALMFVGGVSQLNLSSALVRFVPSAGRRARMLVLGVYATAAATAIVLGTVFLVLVKRVAPELGFLVANRALAVWFVLSCAVWAIFVLEDGALTGLRRAGWVPVENTAFGLSKLVAAGVLAALLPSDGIFIAWSVCTLLTVVPTNVAIFSRALRVASGTGDADPSGAAGGPRRSNEVDEPLFGRLVRYVPYDFAGSLCWLAATALVPVLVIARVGASRGAVVNLCWVVAYAMYLASINLGSSLVVETTSGRSSLASARRVARSHLVLVLGPPAIVLAVVARPLLGLFGTAYAHSGPELLGLLALSAVPFVTTATAVSSYRARAATRNVAVVNVALLAVLVVTTFPLLGPLGPVALGVGWLTAQVVVAGGIALSERSERHLALPAASALTLALARLVTRWKLPRPLRRMSARHADSGSRRVIEELLPDVDSFLRGVATGASSGGAPHLDLVAWTRQLTPGNVTVCSGGSDRAVAQIALEGCRERLLVKVARSAAGAEELRREHAVLDELHADERLGTWRQLLPHWEAGDELRPDCVIERVLPGVDASVVLRRRPELATAVARSGLEAVGALHRRTAAWVVVDEQRLADWLSPALEVLRSSHPTGEVPARQLETTAALESRLSAALLGHSLEVSWVHGDYSPGNVLVADRLGTVSGIVDWSRARPGAPPALDRLLWLAAIHCEVTGQQLGALVRAVLADNGTGPGGRSRRAAAGFGRLWQSLTSELEEHRTRRPRRGGGGPAPADLLVWVWLDHVASNLTKSARYLRSPLWWVANVETVLAAVEHGERQGAASRPGVEGRPQARGGHQSR